MYTFWVILSLSAIVLLIMLYAKRQTTNSVPEAADDNDDSSIDNKKIFDANIGWLQERWDIAKQAQEMGSNSYFPKWYFDDMTDRQKTKLNAMGYKIKGTPSKGQASDLIGLFEPIEPDNEEILRYFHVHIPSVQMNETRGRYEVQKLFSDPENKRKFADRPASTIQKEFFHYFEIEMPHPKTHECLAKAIAEYSESLERSGHDALAGWEAFEDAYEELADRESCHDYGLKSVRLELLVETFKLLVNEGSKPDAITPDDIANAILRSHPEFSWTEQD
ncbi:MAG: hypothetical protein ACYDB9_05240 [Gammaproteobacteria bacterium]